MADIEDRAERWCNEFLSSEAEICQCSRTREALVAAYLAGSAQTQRDYVEHYANKSERKQ